jgi:hypothetical protein
MAKTLLISLISVYILITYQINQSLAFTLSDAKYAPLVDVRSALINEDYHEVIFLREKNMNLF